jgi:hypothetical protein
MKKLLIPALTLFTAGSVLLVSCSKDESAPVITLKGNTTASVDFKGTYTDDGATATDDKDGDLTSSIVVTNPVMTNSAETYTIKYNVSDKAGNAATEVTRTVNVVIKGANMVGTYSVTDKVDTTTYPYQDNITASSTDPNKILVSKFAYYTNGGVYFIISGTNGTTVTIPQQTVVCGSPAASRTFTGSGTITKDGTKITLNYTEVTNGSSTTGVETYTKQ